GHRDRPERLLPVRRQRQERRRAAARQDRGEARGPGYHQPRRQGRREGHRAGPAARAFGHDRGAKPGESADLEQVAGAMNIASLFIGRPRLAFVISTVITIAGVLAMTVLPVAQFPDIVPPQVVVSATYPGASAQAVEEGVAQVLEAQVNGVENMIYMKSGS